MKIAVPSLRQGKHAFRSVTPPGEYGELPAQAGLRLCGEIGVEAVVNKMGEELFVRAETSAMVKIECARCLEEFELPLAAVFEALYVPDRERDPAGPATHRAESESQRILYYSGGVADLGPEVIESLSLATPMKPLCRPDCKGLCPNCGKNLNEGSCGCKRGGDFGTSLKGLLGSNN